MDSLFFFTYGFFGNSKQNMYLFNLFFQNFHFQTIDLNIYELDKSSTRENVPCNSNMCKQTQTQCPSSRSSCRYEVEYLSNDTSSSGFLIEDVLHLITDNDQTKDVDTQVTIG
jgi:hypothetical protein